MPRKKKEAPEEAAEIKEVATKILPTTIEEEMKSSYIDYAMSVIVGRALPDVRDGLKPVHRRILYAMDELGLQPGKPYKKSARIVGECFVKDTLVLTEKGLVPIQDINCGDIVYTQGNKRKVKTLYEMPERELLEVTLDNGISNIVTPSQKIKVLNRYLKYEWKEASKLSLEDYVVVKAHYPRNVPRPKIKSPPASIAPDRLNENIAYLLGLWISDGWIEEQRKNTGLSRLCFFSTSKPAIQRVYSILKEEFRYKGTIEEKERKGYKKGYLLRINRKAVNDFLISNFSLRGRKAPTKEVPQQIIQSPPEVIFYFLSGLIDGDGSIHKSRSVIHYGSVSKKLVDQLQILLQHLRVLTVRYEEEAEKGGTVDGRTISGRQKFYFLEASGINAIRLGQSLDLMNAGKRKKIEGMLAREKKQVKYDIIPFLSEAVFRELSEKHQGGGWYVGEDGEKFRMGIKYPDGSKIRYSSDLWEKPLMRAQVVEWGIKEKLKRIGSPLFNLLDEIINNGIYFLPVASIRKSPAQKTYDIEVEGDHEFVANGMLSHNCLGKYHPHGDTAVYDAMVRMGQEFSLRYMLVDGQGNFGSVDGDPPAAMRYTEARLSKAAIEMLSDIEKETVDFVPNFDESLEEPSVLPSRIPNLLVNGSSGIAVGMATNIPPHNLAEVVDGAAALIENPELSDGELMELVKGPDFPTGALICGKQGIRDAYSTGRGLLTLRARVEFERAKAGKEAIIVTEIPYQVNKAELIEEIAEQVKDKKISGISDLRDESDREGMRIYIEIKRDVSHDVVLNQLYKRTKMQITYGVNLVALVGGEPKLLNLRQAIQEYVNYREEVVTRRTKYDLRKAEEQAHILEGLIIAVSNIDAIIKLIRKSKNPDEARKGLMQKFKLTEVQAQAILDMRLQRLTQLEQYKIEEEYKRLKKLIKELKEILASREKILGVVKNELLEVKEKYADKRRTSLVSEAKEIEIEELIPEEEVAILITRDGYAKRMPVKTFKAQLRGGRGVTGMTTREEDQIENLFVCSTHSFVLFFTNRGRVYKLKVYDIPEASRAGKGQSMANILQVEQGELVTAAVSVESFETQTYLVMATKNGMVKKVAMEDFANIRRSGIIAIKLKNEDELRWVRETDGKQEVILGTGKGLMIRFKEKDVRPMGRAASGVRGIRLGKGDFVVSMDIVDEKGALLAISQGGFGKKMKISEFGAQSRGGKGHIAIKLRDKDRVARMIIIHSDDELLFVTAKGTMSRQVASGISTQGRYAKGVRIQRIDADDYIVDLARVITEEETAEAAKKALEEAEKKKAERLEKIKEERAKIPIKRERKRKKK